VAPTIIRAQRRGIPVWLDTLTGRWFPVMAGADDGGDPPAGDPPGGDPPEGGGDDGKITLTKDEHDALIAKAAEADRVKRDAAEADKRRKREAQQKERDAGNHEAVIRAIETERDDANQRAERAEAQLAEFEQRQIVDRVATRRRWKVPQDAFLFLSPDAKAGDERQVERALQAIENERPYLADPAPPSGLPIGDPRRRGASDMNQRIRRAAGRA
jgi:hypothetical protein